MKINNQRNQKPHARQPRPGQDIIVAKKAENFPSVGMSLSAYRPTAQIPDKEVKPKKKRFYKRITLKRTVISLFLILLIIGGYVGGKFIYDAHKIFGGSLLSIFSTTKLKGEDNGRVTILLAGNSADDPGHIGADLTDSIMLVSIDTKNNKAFLLSIPRDLWVDIPGNNGHAKINDAYVVGQNDNFSQSGYPKGGMGELEEVVSQDFGVQIDYYALINYAAIKDAVNAVGGIKINIQSSDPRGLYDPSIDYATGGPLVNLTNGVHTLDGEQALDLARARGDAYGSYGFDASDFERTMNQRLMLVALKNKVETATVIANPATLTSLFDALGSNVTTDLKLSEVHRLYDLTKGIGNGSISSLSLNSANGKNLLASYLAPDGEDAIIPALGVDDYSDIQAFLSRVSSTNPAVEEGANIVVLNGTQTSGLAGTVRSELVGQGLNVTAIGDALSSTNATTTIIDNTQGKKPATKAALQKIFGNSVTTVNPYSQAYQADFIIVLGQDQVSTTGNSQ